MYWNVYFFDGFVIVPLQQKAKLKKEGILVRCGYEAPTAETISRILLAVRLKPLSKQKIRNNVLKCSLF